MVQERLWFDHHHPHAKTDLVCPPSPENGFDKDRESTDSSEEDLHYGPGIVNKLKNKYLSLVLRESGNSRPAILRKATSLEHLLEDGGKDDEEDDVDGRLFRRRGGGKDNGSHPNRFRSSNRRQDMKRARSVETISRTVHDDDLSMTSSVTTKINNRQSLHEEMLIAKEKPTAIVIDTRTYKRTASSTENGLEEPTNTISTRINRPKRIQPLLNEREKPPVDVVKQAKMIFEKKPEQRTRKPVQTGDVAAKVDSFNNIIVKAKVANNKAAIKHSKPVPADKPKSHPPRPVAKPVILSEEVHKPRTLDLKGSKRNKRQTGNLPSPIPDVSRVDHKNPDGSDPRSNSLSSLCETPDLILTSSPLPVIASPTYKRKTTEKFIKEERNNAFLTSPTETTNRFLSPLHSPTKSYVKPPTVRFGRGEDQGSPGKKLISPISQNSISKHSSATSVFNFTHSHVDQKHLPAVNKNVSESKTPFSEPLRIEVNGFQGENGAKMGLSAMEIEKNQKNAVKSAAGCARTDTIDGDPVEISGQIGKNFDEMASEKCDAFSESKTDQKLLSESTPNAVADSTEPSNNLGKSVKTRDETRQNSDKIGKNFGETANEADKSVKTRDETRQNSGKIGKNFGETANEADKSVKTRDETRQNSGKIGKNFGETANDADKSVKTQDKSCKNPAKPSFSPSMAIKDAFKIEGYVLESSAEVISFLPNLPSAGNEEVPSKFPLPKKTRPKVEESTTAVFNFTARKDVPDYIANDKSRKPTMPVFPRADESGIKILAPDELFKDMELRIPGFYVSKQEEELLRALEDRPPSPCDVAFVNDNILIDGKSCFYRASKRVKLKISFVDDADIFEYPSENSLLLDDSPVTSPVSSQVVGHTVPTLSGSSLATYTPKTTEEFQPGVTRTVQQTTATSKPDVTDVVGTSSDDIFEEVDRPVLFSSGGTADILF